MNTTIIIILIEWGLPRDIARYIDNMLKDEFRGRINTFYHTYRPIYYLKQYVIPHRDTYAINVKPKFWVMSYNLAWYRVVKYARYCLYIVTNVTIEYNHKFDIFPRDFI